MTLRYPDLTPALLAVLRIERALEPAYGDTKAPKILDGYDAWRKRSGSRTPQVEGEGSRDGNMKEFKVIPGPVVPFGGV